jgi:hypothetical protein
VNVHPGAAHRAGRTHPGQIYAVQIRVGVGGTGYSDWSDAVTHMVM